MPYKRKKQSVLKKMFGVQSFVIALSIAGTVFIMGCPDRLGAKFFYTLKIYGITRVAAALVWLALMLIAFATVTVATIKEIRWNNKHIDLPVIECGDAFVTINNYKKTIVLPIADIEKVAIMNKDSTLRIVAKDKKTVIPEYLESNRETYSALCAYLKGLNPDIEFVDSTVDSQSSK